MRISDWSSDVCSSDLVGLGEMVRAPCRRQRQPIAGLRPGQAEGVAGDAVERLLVGVGGLEVIAQANGLPPVGGHVVRSEEHTSELQSLMRISYAVFCLKKKKQTNKINLI